MTTFVIIFNCLCLAWCIGLGVFVLIKRHSNKKKMIERLNNERIEKSDEIEK